jgi:hypothetical protein
MAEVSRTDAMLDCGWRQMRKHLTAAILIATIASSVGAEPLSDQRCAQEAARSFRLSGWKTEDGSAYRSHYNRTLNVCLIEMEGRSQYGVTKSVLDAVEGRTYAIYMWVAGGNKPMMCQLIPSQKEKRDCATEAEYATFAASLMKQ